MEVSHEARHQSSANSTYASPEAIAQVAQEAERLGCGAVWVQERQLRPTHPRQPYGGFMDPWPENYRIAFDPIESLTYAAAPTQRIRLGTSVLDVLYHSPVVLGRRLATLDCLSHGRLIAGLAQGWSDDEFEVVNVPRKRTGAGFEEFLRAHLFIDFDQSDTAPDAQLRQLADLVAAAT